MNDFIDSEPEESKVRMCFANHTFFLSTFQLKWHSCGFWLHEEEELTEKERSKLKMKSAVVDSDDEDEGIRAY